MAHLQVKLDRGDYTKTEIFLDGEKQTEVTQLEIRLPFDEAWTAKIERLLTTVDLDIDGIEVERATICPACQREWIERRKVQVDA